MKTRATEMVIDLKKFAANINEIKNFVGKNVEIMPIVKAHGYGTYIDTQVNFLEHHGVKMLAVACVDEGVKIRKNGFKGNIVVLNPCFENEIENAINNSLTLGVCDINFIYELNSQAKNYNKISKIHLEINTGMNRTGISPDETVDYVKIIKSLNYLELEGIYTHFSSSDIDIDYTQKQIKIFDNCIKKLLNYTKIKYIHASNSGAVINFKNSHYNLVRPGIAIYGHYPNKALTKKINLSPITTLKSKIVHIHEEPPNTSVGYSRSYISKKKIKIAVIPIGYADGLPYNYTGNVIIHNKLAKIISVVNMDNIMVDVTDIEYVKRGDIVFIWDNKKITVEDIAKNCHVSNYEILSRISERVLRHFEE